jgi:hypothetical protein
MEFEKIEQRDFSGGVNWVNDPANIGPTELADARNIRVLGKDILSQRLGFTEYNSTTIGASTEIRSLFQFESQDGSFVPVCQAGAKIYTTAVAVPRTTTTWTDSFTETASASPAIMDAMWGKMVICNNVDGPLVWEGPYGKIAGCKKTVDTASTYQDFYAEAADKDATTHVPLDALDDVAAGDWFLLKSYVPKLTGFRFVVDTTNKNAIAVTLVVEHWTGSAWHAVASLLDGTRDVATSTKTMNVTGNVTFTEDTTVAQSIDGDYGFWWRISSAADALSATVDITSIQTIYNIQLMSNVWDGGYFAPAGFKTTVDTSVTMKDWTEKEIGRAHV